MILRDRSGQLMIIGVLLIFVLLVVVPAILFLNRHTSSHNMFSFWNLKGNSIAEEGIMFGMQQLSQSPTPPATLPPNWPYFQGQGLPATAKVPTGEGGTFSVTYTSAPAPNLQSYQVGILSVPYDSKKKAIPGASIFAVVSQRTVGAKLPTGLSASAALELLHAPQEGPNATLRVELGPIIVRDTAPWTLDTYNTQCISRRPRKFSAGAIYPRTPPASASTNTDQKEYWAYTSPGFAMVIDSATYITLAKATSCPTPICVGGGDCTAYPVGSGSCYFPNVGTDTATWNTATAFPTTPLSASPAVYVNGNAEIDRLTVNMASGPFVVTGNLTLGANTNCGGTACPANGYSPVTGVRAPPTMSREDPYCSCSDGICMGYVDRHLDFSGFLYVQGNLVTTANSNWTVDGVVRVDNVFTVAAGSSLDIFYNDMTNHLIRTDTFDLQIDSMTAVP